MAQLATVSQLYKDGICFRAALEVDGRGYALALYLDERLIASCLVDDPSEALHLAEQKRIELWGAGWRATPLGAHQLEH